MCPPPLPFVHVVCPPVPGYVLYQQYDTYYGDLGLVYETQSASTLDNFLQFASMCDSLGSGCVAFKSLGYLKCALGPAITWRWVHPVP